MTRDEALAFLQEHQPLPPDRHMKKDMIERYDDVRRFLAANPDVTCVRPFLGAFGDGDGLGVYQLAGGVLRSHPRTEVDQALAEALVSPHRSVRYWNAQLAAEFPSSGLVPLLLRLLDEDDRDIKYAALTALEQSSDASVVQELERFASTERDDELRALACEIVDGLRTN